ncbi:MAG: c-type cytochrome [Gammaproteobacteria bacterium]|nr:c-type cytochrome [Gammaproteobacteria bacterium]
MSQHKVNQRAIRFRFLGWSRSLTVVAALLVITALFRLDLDSAVVQAQATLKGDPERGKAKAALCAACHGVAGVSINPLWPSLAGQQEQYLVKQIKAFRDREREEITMQPFVENLSDQDVADLAAFYAGLSPCP